jgi:inosine kinase
MRFPGKRKSKHYFPVGSGERETFSFMGELPEAERVYVVGLDQLLVDIEANVPEALLRDHGLVAGESVVLPDSQVDSLLGQLRRDNAIQGVFAGGSIGNTLHNFSVLSDNRSVALGTICANIRVGDEAFKYLCTTSSHVDFSYLRPVDGPMARALCLVTPGGERTFAIGKGIMNELTAEWIPEEVIKGSSALVVSTYLLRDEKAPMHAASLRAQEIAHEARVPVVFALGTAGLVREKRDMLLEHLKARVSVLAMNESEAEALFDEADPLLALEKALESVDMALLTAGPKGLYMGAWVERELARPTRDMIHSKSIAEYNKYEYSRAMRREDCKDPIKVYTHINPFMGGPGVIKNTNGAGDAALAALLHDLAANRFHRMRVPNSPKHASGFLTYSSIHQVAKYCNRVSFEVLCQNSPRLSRGLPEREDNLEEAYWDL